MASIVGRAKEISDLNHYLKSGKAEFIALYGRRRVGKTYLITSFFKKKFLLAFRDIIKKRAEIQIYEDFEADDPGLVLSEQDFNDYRSKYLDMTVGFIEAPKDETGMLMEPGPEEEYGGHSIDDIDFCLELLHSDVVNVAYILALISDLNPSDENYEKPNLI